MKKKKKPRLKLDAAGQRPSGKQPIEDPNMTHPDATELKQQVHPLLQAKCNPRHRYTVHMEDFELLKVLGTGAYGKVFLVRKLNGHDANKLYAMKVLHKEKVAQKAKTLDHTKTERKVLEAIRNQPFLVTMHYAFQTKSKLHLILDYVNGGELFTHLYQRDHFNENHVKIYIGELILALERLHKVSMDVYFSPCSSQQVHLSPNQLTAAELAREQRA